MDSDDVLGDDGRKAVDACVKVKIVCRPEVPEEFDRGSALELILSCYAGRIPQGLYEWSVFDPLTLFDIRSGYNVTKMERSYTIIDIYQALINFDEVNYVQKYPKEGHRSDDQRDLIDKRRAEVKKEHKEARENPERRREYSLVVAQRRVRDCFAGNFAGDGPVLERKRSNEHYSIIEIYQAVDRIHKEGRLSKYDPDEHLKPLINENWNKLIEEHQEAVQSHDAIQNEYSWSEAEHRVRNCFAGTLKNDTDIFPTKKTFYDIFDIKRAIDNFDTKTLIDKYPKQGSGYDEKKQEVDSRRIRIKTMFDEATTMDEVEYGSGFFINDNCIITNRHVIKTYLDDEQMYEIWISNAVINDLPCKVAHHDPTKDLALLFCPDLNLKDCGTFPLKLSSPPLLQGMSVMCFGYPIHYTGERALFAYGKVSGYKKTLNDGVPLVILQCPLSSGNSGGPVLRRIKGELKVVGVVKQKHIKEILTNDELTEMRNVSKEDSLEGAQTLRLLKFHDAVMGTHSPYNFADALPGHVVANFMLETAQKI